MQWHEQMPSRWHAEQEIAQLLMKDVVIRFDDERRAVIGGSFPLVSEHGHVFDRFRIRVVYPAAFPERGTVPAVYLDSHHHWKPEPDAHMGLDRRLCLFVPGDSGIDFHRSDSLKDLLACVRTFLSKERFYQRDLRRQSITGQPAIWPGPARSHGPSGIREAIQERGGIGRNDPCPCGSGKKFKKCCMDEVR